MFWNCVISGYPNDGPPSRGGPVPLGGRDYAAGGYDDGFGRPLPGDHYDPYRRDGPHGPPGGDRYAPPPLMSQNTGPQVGLLFI